MSVGYVVSVASISIISLGAFVLFFVRLFVHLFELCQWLDFIFSKDPHRYIHTYIYISIPNIKTQTKNGFKFFGAKHVSHSTISQISFISRNVFHKVCVCTCKFFVVLYFPLLLWPSLQVIHMNSSRVYLKYFVYFIFGYFFCFNILQYFTDGLG